MKVTSNMENVKRITFLNPEHVEWLFGVRRDGRITWRCLGLGIALVSFVNRETNTAWPSRVTLSSMTGIDVRDVTRELRELERIGFIETRRRDGGGNIYKISPYGELAIPGVLNTPWDDPPDEELQPEPRVTTPPPGFSAAYNKENKSNYGDGLHGETERDYDDWRHSLAFWDGNRFQVTDEIKAEWRRRYPSFRIEEELRRAALWCRQRNKQPSNTVDFLERWMSRSAADRNSAADAHTNYKISASPSKQSLPPGHNLQSMFEAQGIRNGVQSNDNEQ